MRAWRVRPTAACVLSVFAFPKASNKGMESKTRRSHGDMESCPVGGSAGCAVRPTGLVSLLHGFPPPI